MREVLRCSYCQLNQFRTQNGKCRRCHKAYPAKSSVVVPISNEPASQTPPKWRLAEFGQTVRFWRTFLGMTQATMVNRSGLCRLELGHRKMQFSLSLVNDIAETYQIPIAWLLAYPTPERTEKIFERELTQYVQLLSSEQRREIRDKMIALAGEHIRRTG